jgi:hypothetical protein
MVAPSHTQGYAQPGKAAVIIVPLAETQQASVSADMLIQRLPSSSTDSAGTAQLEPLLELRALAGSWSSPPNVDKCRTHAYVPQQTFTADEVSKVMRADVFSLSLASGTAPYAFFFK